MTETTHQIRYRWAEKTLVGERGMGPVESTVPTDELAAWDGRLRDHVWAASTEPGFTFLATEAGGALIRKVATAAGDGRPGSLAHVVISRSLTARHAIGLLGWHLWRADRLEALPWAEVALEGEQGLYAVRHRARHLPRERLGGLFGQFLDSPGEPFTVVGEDDPAAVVLAFGDLLGWTATFATDEADDTGGHLPEMVFLREAPFSTTIALRRRLSAAAGPPGEELRVFADTLVSAYATGGPNSVARFRPPHPPADPGEALGWARRQQFRPGVLADLTRLHLLDPAVLWDLSTGSSLTAIGEVAAGAPAADLGYALGQSLPESIMSTLIQAALPRALPAGRGNHGLLTALAKHAPLPIARFAAFPLPDIDRLAYVTGLLVDPDDRITMLSAAADQLPIDDLIGWIDERSGADAQAAYAGILALHRRTPHLSPGPDLDVLLDSQLLVAALRRMYPAPPQAAASVAALIRALPAGALRGDAAARLLAAADPAVLHAIEVTTDDPALLDAVDRRVRQAFYEFHNLVAPERARPPGEAGEPAARGSIFRSLRRTGTESPTTGTRRDP